ncbi:MAG: OmpA family protein [Thermodesulfobacteriota bacterium]|nr:OmpA family protein [Thermodesulfobacteriota bacterium]
MIKKTWQALFFLMIGVFFVGCATVEKPPLISEAYNFNPKLQAGEMEQRVDNFAVVFDASQSMDEPYKKYRKFDLAKNTVDLMNRTIPDLKLNGALRTFGHDTRLTEEKTALFYGVTDYTQNGFEKGLNKVEYPGGTTPMDMAIRAMGQDFKGKAGNIAAIIVSDGKDLGPEPLNAAKDVKNLYGERLCFYTILVGDDKNGKQLMNDIAEAGQCGFFTSEDQLNSAEAMADFVKKVFLKESTPATITAKPAPTPAPKPAAKPADSDGDGVYDDMDQCPNTPAGAKVNKKGCWILPTILFDTDKFDIHTGYYADLDDVAQVMKKNPGLKIDIEGFTDSTASDEYNLSLSEKRAQAVGHYLEQKGIEASRISLKGFGKSNPVSSNDTPEGRAKNRRVQIKPIR